MTTISTIDQEINTIRKELRSREVVDQYSAKSWQKAWDRHPELRARETELFRQRGFAQQERDAKAAKVWAAQSRQKRRKKCPTCGTSIAA